MAVAYRLKQLLHNTESTFAQFAESGTPTFTENLPFSPESTFELAQERTPDMAHQARLPVKRPGHPNIRTSKASFVFPLIGHQGTAAGSLTATWQHNLLKRALGTETTNAAGTTVATATNSAAYTLTTTTNWGLGVIGRVGVKGDGRGDGQAAVYAGSGNWINAIPATPNVGDVIYGTTQAYWAETSAPVPINTERFMVMEADSGTQYLLCGGACTGIKVSYPMGGNELPKLTLEYEFAHWRRVATTFPDSTTLSSSDQAPIAGGSFVIQDVGTQTRNTDTPSEVNLEIAMGVQPVMGPGGTGTYQVITNWGKTSFDVKVRVKCPWTSTWETWWDTANASLVYKYVLFTGTATNGRAVGFYCPRMLPSGQRPSRTVEVNELNYVEFEMTATEYTTTSSDQTRASFQIFAG